MKKRKPARRPRPKPVKRRARPKPVKRRPRKVVSKPSFTRKSGIKYRAFIKPHEKLVLRNRFGKVVPAKKRRSNVKYYYEIRDKKTGRLTAYMNRVRRDRETGRRTVEPRKMKGQYFKFVSRPEPVPRNDLVPGYSQKFKVNHSKLVLQQVPKNAKAFISTLYEYAKARPHVIFRITMRHSIEGTFIKTIGIKKGASYSEIASMIGYTITENIAAGRFRMSTKIKASHPESGLVKTLEVLCEILKIES